MTTVTQKPLISLDDIDDDIDQVEPEEAGFVTQDDFARILAEGIFPPPLKIIEEPLDDNNKNFPGDLVLSPSGELLKRYISWEGFGDHHIEVYDNWISHSAYNNIFSRMLRFPDGRTICFENLTTFPPRYTRDGKVLPLTPRLAREQGVTYGSDWKVDLVLRRDGCGTQELGRIKGICIGTIPTMLKSRECILHDKTPEELALLGEDPNDPGGYFIVGGTEKVVLLQEQLALNKIYIMNMDMKGSPVVRMTVETVRGTVLIELSLDKDTRSIIEIKLPSLRVPKQGEEISQTINVLRIFRLFGMTNPNDIQLLISKFMKPENVKKSMFKLLRNLGDFIIHPNDVDVITAKMANPGTTNEENVQEIKRILDNDLFPHLNSLPRLEGESEVDHIGRITVSKLYLLSIMIARFLEHLAGFRPLDNRDSWSNKRVESAGRLMSQLFRSAWGTLLNRIQGKINEGLARDLNTVAVFAQSNIITQTFYDSFITSNWGVKGKKIKNNIAQTLVRDSVVATFAHINTIDVNISRTDRQESLRMIQNDQWGFICPASTPEGENAGILKNLALTAKVSLERSDTRNFPFGEGIETNIINLILGDRNKGIPPLAYMDLNLLDEFPDKIMVNGKFLGLCNGEEIQVYLINLRRQGILPSDMSVIKEDDWLYVDISPSRLVRPLLIVDPDQQLAIDRLNLRGHSNTELLTSGAMEYISAWEQEYIKIATSVDVIRNRLQLIEDANETYRVAAANVQAIKLGQQANLKVDNVNTKVDMTLEDAESRLKTATDVLEKLQKNKPYTHCELDPLAILGIAAALIPWPNHNQAPRNTYQVSMGKQALGIYHSNHLNRMTDGKIKVLAFPNRPMVETEMYSVIGLDEKGPGENINIAFMAFPYTEEDSFVVKKEFLDNGGFRMYKYLTYKTIVRIDDDVVETLTKPEAKTWEPPNRYKYIQMAEKDNPINGLPMIGAPLRQGDCIIGKIQYVRKTKELNNESVILRVGDEGVVDKVLVTSDGINTTVIVKLRVMRVPQEGDKFAPRNAQKGTCGLVMSDIDLPMSEEGLIPDFIVNPHSMPSRMTMEYPMELLAAKYGAYKGVHINAGAFKPFNFNEYREMLRSKGKNEFGYERMRSGTSGKPLEALIYSGPVFFQALKHHVKDKIQARGTGQVKPMTRQPPKGRGNRGGLRFGEMERDAGISHGSSSFLRERLMYASDAYQTAFCKTCGTFAINDPNTNGYRRCRVCGDDQHFGRCTIPYAYKLLVHLLVAPCINLRPEFITSDEYAERIFRPVALGGDIGDIQLQLNDADEALIDEQEEFGGQELETVYGKIYDE